jgi:hypothetical protein
MPTDFDSNTMTFLHCKIAITRFFFITQDVLILQKFTYQAHVNCEANFLHNIQADFAYRQDQLHQIYSVYVRLILDIAKTNSYLLG